MWKKAWYPIAVIQDMDASRPTKLELLGEDLVAWRDGEGTWRVFEDRCPHRSVPLSEGRVESDGTLMCSYHGWRFDGEGQLAKLPQARDGDLPRLQANPRSCASARPTQVRHGVLWVWGESSKDAALEAALVEPNGVPELDDPELAGRASVGTWSHRDLPYGWEVAFENVTDPAHVAVAHHNIVSNRYTDPTPIEIEWERKPTNKDGFKFRITRPQKKNLQEVVSTMDFRPPSQMRVCTSYPATGAALTLLINFVPTKPGHSRLVGSVLMMKGLKGESAPGFAMYSAALPRWLVHVMGPAFLHQDQVFLHHQQVILQKQELKTGLDWKKTYWIPTEADKGVVTLRRWLDRNGGVDYSPAAATSLAAMPEASVLFETYKSHTEKCAACRRALARTSMAEEALKYSAITAGAAGVAAGSWPLLLGGLAMGAGAKACGKLRKLFYESPFNHQDNK